MYHADLKQQKKNQLQFAVRRCLAGNHSNPYSLIVASQT